MHNHRPGISWLPALLAAAVLASCATRPPVRDDPYKREELEAFLSFLREPGATRHAVEGRLGPPHAVFEAGRIAAYRLWGVLEQAPPTSPYFWVPNTDYKLKYRTACEMPFRQACDRHMIQLMIEYDDAEGIRRHATMTPRAFAPPP